MTDPTIEAVARALWSRQPGSRLHPWERLGSLRDIYWGEAAAAITAYKAALHAEGYVIVPREPTEAMKAGWIGPEPWDDDAMAVWSAMLDAAEKP